MVQNKRTNMLMEDLRMGAPGNEADKTAQVLETVQGPRVRLNFKLLEGMASLPDNAIKNPAPEQPTRRLAA